MNRDKEARKALSFFLPNDVIEEKLREIKHQLGLAEAITKPHFLDYFTKAIYWKPFLIVASIHFFSLACGVGGVVPYVVEIFIRAGFDEDKSEYYGAAVAAAQVSLSILY